MQMVKGISLQVIMVHSPDTHLFEQAIFILKDSAVREGITEELLLKEAKAAIRGGEFVRKRPWLHGSVWAFGGAMATGLVWLLTAVF